MGKKTEKEDITSLNINGMLIQNQQNIAKFFNNYFATFAEKLIKSNHMDKKLRYYLTAGIRTLILNSGTHQPVR